MDVCWSTWCREHSPQPRCPHCGSQESWTTCLQITFRFMVYLFPGKMFKKLKTKSKQKMLPNSLYLMFLIVCKHPDSSYHNFAPRSGFELINGNRNNQKDKWEYWYLASLVPGTWVCCTWLARLPTGFSGSCSNSRTHKDYYQMCLGSAYIMHTYNAGPDPDPKSRSSISRILPLWQIARN